MLPEIEYLTYARAHFGQRRFEFASSGLPSLTAAELSIEGGSLDEIAVVERFTRAVAARYQVPFEEVVPCAGASQAIWLVCAALGRPGVAFAVEEPGYEPLWRVPAGLGSTVRRFRREPSEGYAIVPERLVAAAGPGGVAIVTDLHNPTGVRADPMALAEAARGLARTGGYLVVDEVYRDFLVEKEGPVTARGRGANLITISSLTKVHGLSWARAGWVMAPRDVVPSVLEALYHSVGWNPPASSAIGLAALERMERLDARARALCGRKLERAARFVEEHPRLAWVRPDAGIFGLVRTDGKGHRAADITALLAGPLAEREVLVADGRYFDMPGSFRLSLALDEALIEEGLGRLGEVLRNAAG